MRPFGTVFGTGLDRVARYSNLEPTVYRIDVDASCSGTISFVMDRELTDDDLEYFNDDLFQQVKRVVDSTYGSVVSVTTHTGTLTFNVNFEVNDSYEIREDGVDRESLTADRVEKAIRELAKGSLRRYIDNSRLSKATSRIGQQFGATEISHTTSYAGISTIHDLEVWEEKLVAKPRE